ncbi:MAG TPA: hypothetical protein PLO51_05675 [Candidatus Micrarchaeota archaeon]|nr:hypothetical protein [Candidatus Micrarchaeota archaeon]
MQIAGKLITPVPVSNLTKLEQRQDGKWNIAFMTKKGHEQEAALGKNRGKRIFISRLMHEISEDRKMQKEGKSNSSSLISSQEKSISSICDASEMNTFAVKKDMLASLSLSILSLSAPVIDAMNRNYSLTASKIGAGVIGAMVLKLLYDTAKTAVFLLKADSWYYSKYAEKD